MFKLLLAKDLFSKALPVMPKDYIVRLLFNPAHRVACVFRHPLVPGRNPLAGAICFRTFPEHRFAEIAFCAVSSSLQYTGIGKFMMDHFKEHVKTMGMESIVTYADNSAIEYFAKQGFGFDIRLPQDVWVGRIKHYEGAVFVYCRLYPFLNYITFREDARRYRLVQLWRIGIQLSKTPVSLRGSLRATRKDLCDEIPSFRETAEYIEEIPDLVFDAVIRRRAKGLPDDGRPYFQPRDLCVEDHDGWPPDPKKAIFMSVPFSEQVMATANTAVRCNRAAQYAILTEIATKRALDYLRCTISNAWYIAIVPNDLLTMARKAARGFYRNRSIFKGHAHSIQLRCQYYGGDHSYRAFAAGCLENDLLELFDEAFDMGWGPERAMSIIRHTPVFRHQPSARPFTAPRYTVSRKGVTLEGIDILPRPFAHIP